MMTSSQLIELPAPFEAIAYIQSTLASGWALSEALRSLPLEMGRVTSPLPPSTGACASAAFRTGGVASFRKTEAWIAEHLLGLLAPGSGRVALFEDQMARPGDEFLQHETLPYIMVGDTIVYVLGEATPFEDVVGAFRSAVSYMMLGAVIDGRSIDLSRRVIPDDLWRATLVNSTTELLVGAYDMEGVLIWRSGLGEP